MSHKRERNMLKLILRSIRNDGAERDLIRSMVFEALVAYISDTDPEVGQLLKEVLQERKAEA